MPRKSNIKCIKCKNVANINNYSEILKLDNINTYYSKNTNTNNLIFNSSHNTWYKICCNSPTTNCKSTCKYNNILRDNYNKVNNYNSFSLFNIQPDIYFDNIAEFEIINTKYKKNTLHNNYTLF
jgi:hypothetical protein